MKFTDYPDLILKKRNFIISPSLLAADFLHLDKEIEMINSSDADWLHLDIMDGTFVPNISFGFSVLDAVAKICRKPLDVHYMIVHPEDYISQTANLLRIRQDNGLPTTLDDVPANIEPTPAVSMNVHVEACGDRLHDIIRDIKTAGMRAAITISPDTPVETVYPYLDEVYMVLVMSVYPGFGGQSFIEATIDRVKTLREYIDTNHKKVLIEVDGGVNAETAPRLKTAGVDVFVSGSYIFKAESPDEIIKELGSSLI